MRAFLAWACVLSAIGCGDDDAGSVDSGPVEVDAGPAPACDIADTVCPTEPPFPNAPCVAPLSCTYEYTPTDGGGPGTKDWSFQCVDGHWQEMLLCGGCAPRTSESCRSPSAAPIAGATLTLLTATGAPLEDGASVPVIFGGQGGAMIQYMVRVGGIDPMDAPRCVTVRQAATLDTMPGMTELPLALRCGQSLPVFAILPDRPCEFRMYDVTLGIEVVGVTGTQTRNLQVMGGMCPRTLGDVDAGPADAGAADAGP